MPYYIHHHTYQDSTYNNFYMKPNQLIFCSHIDINYDSIFSLSYIRFHYFTLLHIIYSLLYTFPLYLEHRIEHMYNQQYYNLHHTKSKWTKKSFIKVYTNKCKASLSLPIFQRDILYILQSQRLMTYQKFLLYKQ